jgi:hypothetical protein
MKLSIAVAAAAAVALAAASLEAQVQKAEVPGITNFSRVDATVGCGGATQPAAMAELKKQGFTSVINLRTATEPVFIHCASANRVGSVWMIKRALQDGWDINKAETEAAAIGLTNPRLKTFAVDYINTHRK